MYAPPLLSRITLVVSAIVVLGISFIFISRALEPIPEPEIPIARQAETFNKKADLSANAIFMNLNGSFSGVVPDMPMGKSNPFAADLYGQAIESIPGSADATTTAAATFTEAVPEDISQQGLSTTSTRQAITIEPSGNPAADNDINSTSTYE